MLTHGDVSGRPQEEVDEHGEEGGVEAVAGRQRGQHGEGHTWERHHHRRRGGGRAKTW